MNLYDIGHHIQMAGIVAFAMTAVLVVVPQNPSVFTACVMGIITAVGGGTVRDVILNVPVFWAADQSYIWVATGASLVAFWTHQFFNRTMVSRLMLYLDGFGAALFAVQATAKVWHMNVAAPVAPVMMGVLTAIGGGLLRDILAGRRTMLMNQELYALPILIGSILFVVLITFFPESSEIISFICIAITFAMRAAAIYWDLHYPDWLLTKPSGPKGPS